MSANTASRREELSARVDAALRRAARTTARRPAAARNAAADFHQSLWAAVRSEIRWAFTPPRTWLLGVLTNVIFAVMWLAIQPITAHGRHQDWVILVGTYFSSFVLADVTTTNVLGSDHYRVMQGLADEISAAATQPVTVLAKGAHSMAMHRVVERLNAMYGEKQ